MLAWVRAQNLLPIPRPQGPLRFSGYRGGTGQEKHFSPTKGNNRELVNAALIIQKQQCAPAISRELHMKGEEGKLSLMSLSGSGLHSGLESVLTAPWLRDSGAQALRNQADQ